MIRFLGRLCCVVPEYELHKGPPIARLGRGFTEKTRYSSRRYLRKIYPDYPREIYPDYTRQCCNSTLKVPEFDIMPFPNGPGSDNTKGPGSERLNGTKDPACDNTKGSHLDNIRDPNHNDKKEPGHNSTEESDTVGCGTPSLAWRMLPKDDESMVSLFKALDDRLTDHVLNYYTPQEPGVSNGEIMAADSGDFGGIKKFTNLLGQSSRVFVLHAIIANIVLKSVSAEVANTKESALTLHPPGTNHRDYGGAISKIAQDVNKKMDPFAIPDLKSETRYRSMEVVLGIAIDFVIVAESQPTNFEFFWPNIPTELDERMEVVGEASAASTELLRVQAIVFPGLEKKNSKRPEELGYLLAKARVLMY